MVKKAIFFLLFLILIINFVNAVDINFISPQQGDVEIEDRYPDLKQFCDVDWDCTKWGECVNGYKTRICIEDNNCQYEYDKPLTRMKCREEIKIQPSADIEEQILFFSFFTGLLLLILLIILLGLRR